MYVSMCGVYISKCENRGECGVFVNDVSVNVRGMHVYV